MNISSLALSWSTLLAAAAGAQTPPQTFNHSVTYGGTTVTVNFTKFSCRGPHFAAFEQRAGGALVSHTPGPVRTYLGTVAGRPGAIAAGLRRADGTVLARVTFEDGVEWSDDGGSVSAVTVRAFTPRFPEDTLRNGGAGATLYAAEVGIDLARDQVVASGGTTATGLEMAEFSVMSINTTYLRDAAIINRLERVVARSDPAADPYAGMSTMSALLGEVVRQWNTVLPAGNHDLALVAARRFGGSGVAHVGVVGSPGHSANGSSSNGDFSRVARHELGHNWFLLHYDGGTPEGPTINSGNSLGKLSGPEIELALTHRTERVGFLDNLGTPAASLPPRAADDGLLFESGTGDAAFDVLANDNDVNGQPISILSFDPRTRNDLTVTRLGDQLVVGSPLVPGYDFFSYRIQDAGGLASTAVCHLRTDFAGDVLGHWNFEGSTTQVLDSSPGARHGTLVGDAWINAGGELVLDGDGDYANVPPPGVSTDTATYAAWIYREGNQSDHTGIVLGSSKRGVRRSPGGLVLRTGNWLGFVWPGSPSFTSTLAMPNRTWTFVAVVLEPGRATVYMNDGTGLRSFARAAAHAPASLVGALHLGHHPDGNSANPRFFRGRMDDARLFDRALTAAEINDLAARGGGASNPSPIATGQRLYASSDYTEVRDGAPGSAADLGAVAGGSRLLTSLRNGHYFWRVDSTEPSGVHRGNIWYFTTTNTGTVAAVERIRLGNPPNPDAFRVGATSGPVTGQIWDPAIDHSNFVPNATLDFALIAFAQTHLAIGQVATGLLLVDLSSHVALTAQPGQALALPIPNDPTLLGRSYYTQGGAIDTASTPGLHFANGIDIVVGDH